ESAVGGTGLGKALRALDALRFVLNGAALGHSALAAVQLPARRILGVAVCGCGAGQRERCRERDQGGRSDRRPAAPDSGTAIGPDIGHVLLLSQGTRRLSASRTQA